MFEYMNYLVVILVLGIILVGLLILLVVTIGTQKRKQIQELNTSGEKLEKLLAESETMIDELNRFSDYVVNLMEEKNTQLKATGKYAEDILSQFEGLIHTGTEQIKNTGNEHVQSIPVKKDKVVPLNPKHREILELAEYGLTDTDIAKSLQMGKGEVRLILGMKKG